MRAARPKPPTDLHRICSNSLRLSGACKASSHATPSHGATTLVRKCREWYANESHMIFETYVICLLPIVVSQGQLQATGTLLHPEDRWNGIRQYRYHRRLVDLLCSLQRRVPETNCNVSTIAYEQAG